MKKEAHHGTWIESDQPSAEIVRDGYTFVESGRRVFILRKEGQAWKPLGRMAMYGMGTVGERMVAVNLDEDSRGDLNTSPVRGVTVDGESFVIRTASGSLYKVETFDAPNLPGKHPIEAALAAVGERLLRLFS